MQYSELNDSKNALPEEKPNHVGGETHKFEGGKKKKTQKKKAKKVKKVKKTKTAKKRTKKTGLLKKVMKLFK